MNDIFQMKLPENGICNLVNEFYGCNKKEASVDSICLYALGVYYTVSLKTHSFIP